MPLLSQSEPAAAPIVHPHDGFVSCIDFPAGEKLFVKNVRLWKAADPSTDWLLEPLHAAREEDAWTEIEFDAPRRVYHRGALTWVSLGGIERVERRSQARPIEFANGGERSIVDLGTYIGGKREDGAIVFQTEVESDIPGTNWRAPTIRAAQALEGLDPACPRDSKP